MPDPLAPTYLWLLILLALLIPLPVHQCPPLAGDANEHTEWC